MRKAFLYIACVITLVFAACNEDTYEVFPEETSHLSANNAIAVMSCFRRFPKLEPNPR